MIYIMSVLTNADISGALALESRAEQFEPLFPSEQIVMTQGVHRLVQQGQLRPLPYLVQHFIGDWGQLCEEDVEANRLALIHGHRLFSNYEIDAGDEQRLWIITDADRRLTTLLLPSEY